MNQTIDIPAFEHGVVRVLTGDFPSEAALRAYALPEGAAEGAPWPLRDDLGASALDPRGVEAFPMANLKGMGLPGYLRMAYGVSEREASDPALAEAGGGVILIASRAFGGRAARLAVPDRLRHLGAFHDAEAAPGPAPSPGRAVGGAAGTTAERPPPDASASNAARPAVRARAAGAGAMALGVLLVGGGILANELWLWVSGLVLAAIGAFAARRARRRDARGGPGRAGGTPGGPGDPGAPGDPGGTGGTGR